MSTRTTNLVGELASRTGPWLAPRSTPAVDRTEHSPGGRWFENVRADLQTYGGDWNAPGFWAMAVYRLGRWRYGIKTAALRIPFSALYKTLFKLVQIATGIELPCEAEVGRNFLIVQGGCVVVSGFAKFGDNCSIRTGVCIGLSRVDDPTGPVIGNNVDIGAGAKVLGRITIGNNVTIGPNAVVLRNVPSDSSAAGVPAVVSSRVAARTRKYRQHKAARAIQIQRTPVAQVFVPEHAPPRRVRVERTSEAYREEGLAALCD